MTIVREPILTTITIAELHPTQITVGMREVLIKRKRWRETAPKEGAEFLGNHLIPVVLGRSAGTTLPIIIISRAPFMTKASGEVAVTVVIDLSQLDRDEFWIVMDNRNLMHPFDAKGRRHHYRDIPKSVSDLVDDPYRSLSGELRRAGGFAKDTTLFSEFLWAAFLRRRIKRSIVEHDFDRAIAKALKLAESRNAEYLPGWCGPAPEI